MSTDVKLLDLLRDSIFPARVGVVGARFEPAFTANTVFISSLPRSIQ